MKKDKKELVVTNDNEATNFEEKPLETNTMEAEIRSLKQDIRAIQIRNKKVELDKKWETSITRKICICLMTYLIVLIYSLLIRNLTTVAIIFTSFVPVIGFTLSTLSLKFIRKIWEKKIKNDWPR